MSHATVRFRILHFLYHRGSAVQHWFSMRIRPAGIGALLIVSLGSFMSIGQPRNSIFQIFCLSLGMVSLALFWVIFRRARLSATFQLPRQATVGKEISYSVSLKNIGKYKVRAALIAQTPADPRPTLREFSQTPEPGEEKRNIFDRMMAFYRWQWLLSGKKTFQIDSSASPVDLDPDETTRLTLRLTPLRRGVIPMEKIRAQLPDPLGFFQKNKLITAPTSSLVVLPKRYRLPPIVMPGSAAFRIGGEETSNAIGSSGEFVGLRDYRPGDPLRLIHWKSWAHTGRPVVKELEDTFYPRYALVIDTFPGSADEQVFEEIVSIAASFIVALDQTESLLDLMFISGKTYTVTAGRNMERTDKLLEALAAVQIDPAEDFATLSKSVRSHKESVTSCLLILNGWDTSREDFVKSLLKAGIPCVPLVIGNGPAPEGTIGHWLDAREIARDLLRLPTHLSAAN
ncbi:DUF58 domain-containing protein [Luteolibacter sp. AS25]|uniref:DUF58 domain-containing protein n=1 Tax=Luteolibacter sp. AS25 TaxID=3135776 RepID=UPI00398B18BB